MCGIFAILNNSTINDKIEKSFNSGNGRGPEFSKLSIYKNHVTLGFHRLAINGLNNNSNQPLNVDNILLICNGEIYNYKSLYSILEITPTTQSDCEVIIHCYKKYNIEYTLELLDGVFAFVLYDTEKNEIYCGRDRYGVRPMFQSVTQKNSNQLFFSSELKMIHELTSEKIEPFLPGTYSKYEFIENDINRGWNCTIQNKQYFIGTITQSLDACYNIISNTLENAVKKRIITTERPVACLLSGGLDSSLITSMVSKFMNEQGKQLETYSIGLEGSDDLKYAKIVADYLKTKHNEIIVTEKDFLDAIPEVIKTIESYDTTTVRASVGNYLVAKYIKEHSEAKVIFNGDGSDEVTGGYLYFHNAPDSYSFDKECKRLLKDIHYFDVLRSDRCISCHGLEARTPFLDKEFVNHFLSLPHYIRDHNKQKKCEKYMLRAACAVYLPNEVLYRTKEAFSDGVSKQTRSWYEIIQEHIETLDLEEKTYLHNPPTTKEQLYYRNIFESYYPNRSNVIPYFWMPKFVENAKDSSARTLNIYKEKMKK